MERLPYRATEGASAYENLRLPVSILLDNVRSMYNVGAFFRTDHVDPEDPVKRTAQIPILIPVTTHGSVAAARVVALAFKCPASSHRRRSAARWFTLSPFPFLRR